MAREKLPSFNASEYGDGIEGATNYANSLVDYLMLPAFLLILYGLAIFVWTKSDYKMGGGIFFISLVFFLMGIVAQTFTMFAQVVIFIFFIGMIAGIVIHFVEG